MGKYIDPGRWERKMIDLGSMERRCELIRLAGKGRLEGTVLNRKETIRLSDALLLRLIYEERYDNSILKTVKVKGAVCGPYQELFEIWDKRRMEVYGRFGRIAVGGLPAAVFQMEPITDEEWERRNFPWKV